MPENRAPSVAPRPLGQGDFVSAVRDHYLTNPVARASRIMGELAALQASRAQRPMAAE